METNHDHSTLQLMPLRTPEEGPPPEPRASRSAESAFHDRDALASYFAEIGDTRTLTRDDEVVLGERIETATAAFRNALLSLPWTSAEAVASWHSLRARRRNAGRLSESFTSPGGAAKAKETIDRIVPKLERALARREKLQAEGAAGVEALARNEASLSRLLHEADLSLRFLERARDRVLARVTKLRAIDRQRDDLASPRRRPRTEEGRRQRRRELRRLQARAREIEGNLGIPRETLYERCDEMELAFAQLCDAKNTFVRHNLKLAVKVVREFRELGVPWEDLIQEGNIGLVRAVEKFDHRKGFKFSTYAVWWIRQAAIRAVQNHGRTIRIPSHREESYRRYERQRSELEKQLGRPATPDEIAQLGEMDPLEAEELARLRAAPLSLDSPLWEDDGRRVGDVLPDAESAHPDDRLDDDLLAKAAQRELSKLTERESQILRWRFGLDDGPGLTLEEIGKRLGISRERVRQIEARALARMRGPDSRLRGFALAGA